MVASVCTVLVVDDRPDEGVRPLAANLSLENVKCLVRHPSEVDETDLKESDLVLVDFQLDDWPSRDATDLEIALRPIDGIALESTLRRHANSIEKTSPTAFAILTGRMPALAAPLPTEHREHILSLACRLEWVFSKKEHNLAGRIKILGKSIKSLPKIWSASGIGELNNLLAISKSRRPWQDQMTEDAIRCLPPVHELSTWSHGLSFIRWMLQRILPYPTFLIGPIHLAARLGVDPTQLDGMLENEQGQLRKALKPCEYKGVLKDFSGPRWWRVAIEALLWERTKGNSFDASTVHGYLATVSGSDLLPSTPPVDPVVCYDENFRPLLQLGSIDNSVRVRPDDWPAYAEEAWAAIENTQGFETLRSVVVNEDASKLKDE